MLKTCYKGTWYIFNKCLHLRPIQKACSCRFLHPNYLFQYAYNFSIINLICTSSNEFKKNCSQKYFDLSQFEKKCYIQRSKIFVNSQPSALILKQLFLITRTIFSHSRLEQFSNQNTTNVTVLIPCNTSMNEHHCLKTHQCPSI